MKSTENYGRIERAIQYIQKNHHTQPSLEDIARHVGLSKFHFQRTFQDWAGISPKSFLQYLTVEHAKKLLAQGQTTLHASYDVGLSGNGRLHDLFIKIESVTPGEYKNQGEGLTIFYQFYESLFGQILIAETKKGVCHLSFVSNKKEALKDLRLLWKKAKLIHQDTKQAKAVLAFLNNQKIPDQKIRLNLRGTEFQIKVWEALLKIPSGQLMSYGDLAENIKHPKASRAVGSAIGRNPIAYLIPCHRVIRSAGQIGQYRWGSARKAAFIGWESVDKLKEI